ncbi:hypothetical protein HZA43_02085 [Candidatus Peregrinibacteria bacterium]|nr:hypothetical protein [Candidatus Peregrinibacteria bacterium]
MTTLSFKATDDLKNKIVLLAGQKGINVSATIKLLLTQALKKELGRVTENGMTVMEELAIIYSDEHDKVYGPFKTVKGLIKSLKE